MIYNTILVIIFYILPVLLLTMALNHPILQDDFASQYLAYKEADILNR